MEKIFAAAGLCKACSILQMALPSAIPSAVEGMRYPRWPTSSPAAAAPPNYFAPVLGTEEALLAGEEGRAPPEAAVAADSNRIPTLEISVESNRVPSAPSTTSSSMAPSLPC